MVDLQPRRPLLWSHEAVQATNPDVLINDTIKIGHLCPKCQEIQSWSQLNASQLNESDCRKSFHHHLSGVDLEMAYKAGCHLCTLLWHNLIEKRHGILATADELVKKREARLAKIRKGGAVLVTLSSVTDDWDRMWDAVFNIQAFVQIGRAKLRGDTMYVKCIDNIAGEPSDLWNQSLHC
jgi:hypothetical protein